MMRTGVISERENHGGVTSPHSKGRKGLHTATNQQQTQPALGSKIPLPKPPTATQAAAAAAAAAAKA